jgi:hypothetical protein
MSVKSNISNNNYEIIDEDGNRIDEDGNLIDEPIKNAESYNLTMPNSANSANSVKAESYPLSEQKIELSASVKPLNSNSVINNTNIESEESEESDNVESEYAQEETNNVESAESEDFKESEESANPIESINENTALKTENIKIPNPKQLFNHVEQQTRKTNRFKLHEKEQSLKEIEADIKNLKIGKKG